MFSNLRFFAVVGLVVMVAVTTSSCRSYKGFSPREVEKKAQAFVRTDEEPVLTDPNIAYLESNAKKEGVIVRPSGLQIRVLRQGAGGFPSAQSELTVQYEGRLVDGTVFDTTRETGSAQTFVLEDVIRGWREALMLMREGSFFELVIPANLAYGRRGSQGVIPPNATLVFEVELVRVTRPLEVKSALDN